MTSAPDPLDAPKYLAVVAHGAVEDVDHLDHLHDLIEVTLEAFVGQPVTGAVLDRLLDSAGRPVSVTAEISPGRQLQSHFPPPGPATKS